jgi:hypothetical protein
MINKYLAMGLGALIALAPVATMAQVQVAQATTDQPAAAPATATHTGTHRGHQRRKGRTAHHRARASAEHMRKKMTTPAAPEAPKS